MIIAHSILSNKFSDFLENRFASYSQDQWFSFHNSSLFSKLSQEQKLSVAQQYLRAYFFDNSNPNYVQARNLSWAADIVTSAPGSMPELGANSLRMTQTLLNNGKYNSDIPLNRRRIFLANIPSAEAVPNLLRLQILDDLNSNFERRNSIQLLAEINRRFGLDATTRARIARVANRVNDDSQLRAQLEELSRSPTSNAQGFVLRPRNSCRMFFAQTYHYKGRIIATASALGVSHLLGINSWAYEAAEHALASPLPFQPELRLQNITSRNPRLESSCANSVIENALRPATGYWSGSERFEASPHFRKGSKDRVQIAAPVSSLLSTAETGIDRVVILLIRRTKSGSETLYAGVHNGINDSLVAREFEIIAPENTIQRQDKLELRVCHLRGSNIVSVYKKNRTVK